MSATEQPKDQREHYADHNAGHNREIKNCIFAAINNIARKPAQWKIEFSRQQDNNAKQKDHATHNQQKFSQISHFDFF